MIHVLVSDLFLSRDMMTMLNLKRKGFKWDIIKFSEAELIVSMVGNKDNCRLVLYNGLSILHRNPQIASRDTGLGLGIWNPR